MIVYFVDTVTFEAAAPDTGFTGESSAMEGSRCWELPPTPLLTVEIWDMDVARAQSKRINLVDPIRVAWASVNPNTPLPRELGGIEPTFQAGMPGCPRQKIRRGRTPPKYGRSQQIHEVSP